MLGWLPRASCRCRLRPVRLRQANRRWSARCRRVHAGRQRRCRLRDRSGRGRDHPWWHVHIGEPADLAASTGYPLPNTFAFNADHRRDRPQRLPAGRERCGRHRHRPGRHRTRSTSAGRSPASTAWPCGWRCSTRSPARSSRPGSRRRSVGRSTRSCLPIGRLFVGGTFTVGRRHRPRRPGRARSHHRQGDVLRRSCLHRPPQLRHQL